MTIIGYPCTPAIDTKLDNLGERKLIVVNGGGGMGGSRETFVAEIKNLATKVHNFIEIELTESKRKLKVNPNWVGSMEDVTLYKRTHRHNNPNFKDKTRIDYIFVKGDEEIVLVKEFLGGDELKGNKLCGYIDKDQC